MKKGASLDDELEFFMDLRDTLTKEKERFVSNYCRSFGSDVIFPGVNSTPDQICAQTETGRDLPYQKIMQRLGIVDRHIKILRKRLGTIRIAHSIPQLTEMEIDRGQSLWEDKDEDEESILEPEAISDDADGAGYEEEEDETDRGKSAMKEQPSIGSHLKLAVDAVAGTAADEVPIEEAILKLGAKNLYESLNRDESAAQLAEMTTEEEMDCGKSAAQLAEMTTEEQIFAQYRLDWESSWSQTHSSFPDTTAVSSMQFTHLASGRKPYGAHVQTSLQIFTFKLAELKGSITWPLSVYGVVAIRDALDRNRNILFCRGRDKAQRLTQDDPSLRLTGPSRAIVFTDPVYVEVQLRVKGSTKSGDRALISKRSQYRHDRPGVYTIRYSNCFCKTELCLERVARSVQATILGVRVVEEKDELWPFKYGARVACSPITRKVEVTDTEIKYIPDPSSGEIVLLDSKDGLRPDDDLDGYLCLSRQVVSVQVYGELQVKIQAYSSSGDFATEAQVCFEAKCSNISHGKIYLDNVELEITVAWSLLVSDKQDIGAGGWEFETDDMEIASQSKS